MIINRLNSSIMARMSHDGIIGSGSVRCFMVSFLFG